MELVYTALDTMLPFDWLNYKFMKHAFLAVLMITPLFGILSTMIVSNRMAFFSDSLGHGAFTGLAIGVVVGLFSPMVSLVAFSVAFAMLITWIKNKSKTSTDTIIGVFSSMGIAAGLMIMSYGGGFNKFSGYLIGDVLSVTAGDLQALLFVFFAVLIVWGLIFNKLLVLSINSSFALSRGINQLVVEGIFASMVAVVVAVSIQWVGLLIINSLLVLPAAAARNISGNVKSYHVVSVLCAMVSGIGGLVASYYFDMATGATIVVVAAILFFFTLLAKDLLHIGAK